MPTSKLSVKALESSAAAKKGSGSARIKFGLERFALETNGFKRKMLVFLPGNLEQLAFETVRFKGKLL